MEDFFLDLSLASQLISSNFSRENCSFDSNVTEYYSYSEFSLVSIFLVAWWEPLTSIDINIFLVFFGITQTKFTLFAHNNNNLYFLNRSFVFFSPFFSLANLQTQISWIQFHKTSTKKKSFWPLAGFSSQSAKKLSPKTAHLQSTRNISDIPLSRRLHSVTQILFLYGLL